MSSEGTFFLVCISCAFGVWLGGREQHPRAACPEVDDLQTELRRIEGRLQTSERLREVVVEEVLKQKLTPQVLARAVRRVP